MKKVHFVGAAGAGVGALAQFHVMGGGTATGSDRAFDRGDAAELRTKLERLGMRIFPQDGSALNENPDCVVASAAVEENNADLTRAKEMGLTVLHRADCLARHVERHKTIAVGGTSGKSTVVAMIYDILEAAGRSPSVITGGALLSLERRGFAGNAFRGKSDLLVVEADESDGTLVRYRPWLGVLLNLSKDHKEPAELREMFASFRARCAEFVVNADAPEFEPLQTGVSTSTFGLERGRTRPRGIDLSPEGSSFTVDGIAFSLPAPGRHNVENAVAAVAACRRAGVELAAAAKALSGFQGVARRFQRVGEAGGVEVIDDFAHNPVKVAAALAAARLKRRRILAVFQLHGFAPALFMKEEFIVMFSSALDARDVLWMPEIYYAGGTAAKDISAKDIAQAVAARGKDARFAPDKAALAGLVAQEARPGDCVLVMGARDPGLSAFAAQILQKIKKEAIR